MAATIGNFIDRIQLGTDDTHQIAIGSSAYAVCETIASTQVKEITIPGFTLNTGTTIHVKFIYENTATDPQLKIGTGTPQYIVQYGIEKVGTNSETAGWQAGAVLTLTYDGTNWVRDQGYNTNTSYTHPTTSGNKHIPSGGSAGKILGWASDGTAEWIDYSGGSGDGNSYKSKQTAFIDNHGTPDSTITTDTYFISSFSQNEDGLVYDITTRTLPHATAGAAGIIAIGTGATDALAGNTVVTNVSFTNITSSNYEYPVLFKNTTGTTNNDGGVCFISATDKSVTINGSTGKLSAEAGFIGDVTGDLTGTASYATADSQGNTIHTTYAPINSPEFTGTPLITTTPADGDSSHKIADTAFVMNTLKYVDAMLFKGTIGDIDDNPTVTSLPIIHEAGWAYRVVTAATYSITDSTGRYCEEGTLIICTTDGTASNPADWTAIETNEDGAVIGPTSSTNNDIVTFSATSGRVIQDSGKTFSTATPTTSSTDNQIPTSKAVWAAINGLDTIISGCGAEKTLATLTESDGIISATFQNIAISLTAAAESSYWNFTGSNNNETNKVKYSLAPYSSKQNGANFYTGTTAPDGTDRLNYNGYFYATNLYSSKVYPGTNTSYGNAYTPIYWNDGVPAEVTIIKKYTFSFADSGATTTVVTPDNINIGTHIVTEIVVDTGISYLNGSISWNVPTTGDNANKIVLTTIATSGTVSGYILVSTGS